MGKKKKNKRKVVQNKKQLSKKTVRIIIIAAAVALVLIVAAILWLIRPKSNGVYSWYGTKMDADYILNLTIDVDGEKEYKVPFSEYRALYLYYGERVSDFISYDSKDENNNDVTISKFVTTAAKSSAVKEATDMAIIEYYNLIALADYLGVGLKSDEDHLFDDYYNKLVAEYAETTEKNDTNLSNEEYAIQQYEKSIAKLGMTKDYLKYSFFRSLLLTRVKEAISPDLENVINESYSAYKQVYIPFTKGDSAEESAAFQKITEAKNLLDNGTSIDEVIKKYGAANTTTTYFDYNHNIVNSSTNNSVGTTIGEMVKSLDFGEYSVIMSGDESTQVGYYVILYREYITADFVCGDSVEATIMYQYPYVGSSVKSSQYNEFMTYMDAFEMNTKKEPVSKRVYNRIALNTLF